MQSIQDHWAGYSSGFGVNVPFEVLESVIKKANTCDLGIAVILCTYIERYPLAGVLINEEFRLKGSRFANFKQTIYSRLSNKSLKIVHKWEGQLSESVD